MDMLKNMGLIIEPWCTPFKTAAWILACIVQNYFT